MLNSISIMGRLASDPQLRRTGSGKAVTSFSVACERDFADKQSGKKEVDFIECVAWGSTAEVVEKHFSKGRMISLTGRLHIRVWTDKNGQKRRSAEIFVEAVYFCGAKETGAQRRSAPENGNLAAYPQTQAQNFDPITDFDGGLPF